MTHGHPHPGKITVYHAAAPTCHWSWGYEGVMNRLRMVYGDQIDVRLLSLCVWENFEDYLKEYELDFKGFNEWMEEIGPTIGLPIALNYPRDQIPDDLMPASLATMAAFRQGHQKGERYLREILRRFCVEFEDVTGKPALLDAAASAGLDAKKFARDLKDTRGIKREYASQGHGWPELPLSYYALVVSDGKRHVLLEHAFEPAVVEGAVDYLGGGRLKKRQPTDIAAYLRRVGPAPTTEVARVFALTESRARQTLASLERSGKVRRVTLAGAPHWTAP